MISSFGRGFDSLQLHNLDKKLLIFSGFCFLEGISVLPFFKTLCLKSYAEPGDTVGIGTQREVVAMLHQHFADEDEADALTIRFGREEGAEQLRFHLFADASPGVAHL